MHWRSSHVGRTARVPRLRAANDNGDSGWAHWLFVAAALALLLLACADIMHGRDSLPRHGRTTEYELGDFARPESDDLTRFGRYSLEYYRNRWQRMCEGPQRYDAMREADSMRQPMPCR